MRAEHEGAELVDEGVAVSAFGLDAVVVGLPCVFALEAAVVAEAVDVGLPGGVVVFVVVGEEVGGGGDGVVVAAVKVEGTVYSYYAAVEVGEEAETDVVGHVAEPVVGFLGIVAAHEEAVAYDGGEELALGGVFVGDEGGVSGVGTAVVVAVAEVVAADGMDLSLNLVGVPDVVLVGEGYEVACGAEGGGAEVFFVAEAGGVDPEVYVGVSGGVLSDDVGGVVGAVVVLYDDLV